MIVNKKIIIIFSLLFFILSFLSAAKVLLNTSFPDFSTKYYGASYIINLENPYVPDDRYFTNSVYPLFTFLLFIPFQVLSYEAASLVWVALALVLLLATLYLCFRIINEEFFSPLPLFLSGLAFLSFPLKFSLGMGQINPLILFVLVIAIYTYVQKKEFMTGLLLGFIYNIKFFPLALLPYLVLRKKWRIILGIAIVSLLGNGLLLILGYQEELYYFLTFLLPDLVSSWKGDYYNQAFTGLLMRTVDYPDLRALIRPVVTALFALVTYGVILRKKEKTVSVTLLIFSVLITINVLINNFSWQHHYLFLLPAYIFTYSYMRKNNVSVVGFSLLFLSYLLVSLNLKNPQDVPVILQSHVLYGGVLLWLLQIYLLLKEK